MLILTLPMESVKIGCMSKYTALRTQQVLCGCRLFHCVSRVVNRGRVFGVRERNHFQGVLRRVETFTGVRVLTWTMMSNHFHVLLALPQEEEMLTEATMSDEELVRRVTGLYGRDDGMALAAELEDLVMKAEENEDVDGTDDGGGARRTAVERRRLLREGYIRRMGRLSEFMKCLKQRFSIWFNRNRGWERDRKGRKTERIRREGTLWEGRFRSVAVGGSWESVMIVAAYIDLNCVRAGVAKDPKDYRWCGYAEAVGGSSGAREGLTAVMAEHGGEADRSADWARVGAEYRKLLYGEGRKRGAKGERGGFSEEKVEQVMARDGKLGVPELLRCRIRYFTAGAAVGTREFVDGVFESAKAAGFFGGRKSKRKTGARRMRGGEWGAMRSLRDLRVDPVSGGKAAEEH